MLNKGVRGILVFSFCFGVIMVFSNYLGVIMVFDNGVWDSGV